MWTWVIETALVTGLLAAAVLAVCRYHRSRPALCHGLWLLILLRLVLPPLPVPSLTKPIFTTILAVKSAVTQDKQPINQPLPYPAYKAPQVLANMAEQAKERPSQYRYTTSGQPDDRVLAIQPGADNTQPLTAASTQPFQAPPWLRVKLSP